MKELSIILPVFNEEENILSIFNQLKSLISKIKFIQFEIIAINDGSTDRSLELLKQFKIKIINNPKRIGYGASLKRGIKNASHSKIAILDADGTYPPFELYRLFRYADHAKFIIGSRANYNSSIRHFANKTLALIATFLLKKQIFDLNSGMRLFEKRALEQLEYESWSDEFSFTTTMTLSAILTNLSIKEVPIRCDKRRGKSKLKIIRVGWTILKMIFQFFKKKYATRRNR